MPTSHKHILTAGRSVFPDASCWSELALLGGHQLHVRNTELMNQPTELQVPRNLFMALRLRYLQYLRQILGKKNINQPKPQQTSYFQVSHEATHKSSLPSWHNYEEGISLGSVSCTPGREGLCERPFKIW